MSVFLDGVAEVVDCFELGICGLLVAGIEDYTAEEIPSWEGLEGEFCYEAEV